MRTAALLLVVVVAITVGALVWMLPPAQQTLTGEVDGVRGAIHVHTRRSDGSGTLQEVAAAAARARLQFVILTDHGDGTRAPEPPTYHSGVLVIDAVEISADGHVIALGLPRAPYPLGGEVRDIIEDVARMGGLSIAAHPGSMKPELRWTDWSAPFNGLEWLNGDSESRSERWPAFAQVLLTYPWRPSESLATLLDRPDDVLRRWDALTARRRVVAVAGADAHARIGVADEGWGSLLELRLPSYEAMFRSFSVTVQGVRFHHDAIADAKALLDGIAGGHLYCSVDAVAAPAVVSFRAVRNGTTWVSGDLVPPDGGGVELLVDANVPAGGRIVLLKNGQRIAEAAGSSLRHAAAGERAVYRAEVHAPGGPGTPAIPWVVTNPIYVRAGDDAVAPRAPAKDVAPQYANGPMTSWHTEMSGNSQAALDVVPNIGGTELLLRWALGGLSTESSYVASVMAAGPMVGQYDRVMFTARTEQPMRLSVQLRTSTGERWRRSVYLDDSPRDVTVFFDEMRPIGRTSQRRLPLDSVRDVLFVIDRVNTALGAAGKLWIDEVKYGR